MSYNPYLTYDQLGQATTGAEYTRPESNQSLYMREGANEAEAKENATGNRPCMQIMNREHKHKIVTKNGIVVVNLFGEWCGPCKQIKPKFVQLSQEYTVPGKVMLCQEDVDLGLSSDLNVKGVPAFVFYVNGRNIGIIEGADMSRVRDTLDDLLKKTGYNAKR
jgi:thioredoxin 1